jgi:hypothetical protein
VGTVWSKFAFSGLMLAVLLGCKSPSAEQPVVLGIDSIVPVDTASALTLNQTAPRQAVELLAYDAHQIPSAIQYEGRLHDGAHWRDHRGESWLVISELIKGMCTDPGFVSVVYGACWRNVGGEWKQVWSIQDANQKDWESRSYMPNTLKIVDLDNDSIAESVFLYELGHEGNDPTDFKLMLHVKDVKYALRGTLASEKEGIGQVEKRVPDPKFKEIDPLFLKYAEGEWDAFRRVWYGEM